MKLSLFSLYGAAALVFANGVAADDNENSIVSHKKISRRKLLERTTRKTKHSGKGGKGKGGKKCKGEGDSAALEAVADLKGGACPLWDDCTFKNQRGVFCDYCDFETGEVIEFFSRDVSAIADYDSAGDFGFAGISDGETVVSRRLTSQEAFDCGQIVYDACLNYIDEEELGDACDTTVEVCNTEPARRNLGDEQDSLAMTFKERVGVPKNKREGKDRRLFGGKQQASSAKNSGAPKVLGSKNFLIFAEGEDKWTCQKQGI